MIDLFSLFYAIYNSFNKSTNIYLIIFSHTCWRSNCSISAYDNLTCISICRLYHLCYPVWITSVPTRWCGSTIINHFCSQAGSVLLQPQLSQSNSLEMAVLIPTISSNWSSCPTSQLPCFSVSTNPRYHCWSSTTTKYWSTTCHPEISCSNKKSQCPLQIPLHLNSHLIFPNT